MAGTHPPRPCGAMAGCLGPGWGGGRGAAGAGRTKTAGREQVRCEGETVVDLYAGIGYFTLPLLVLHTRARAHALACVCVCRPLRPGRRQLWPAGYPPDSRRSEEAEGLRGG